MKKVSFKEKNGLLGDKVTSISIIVTLVIASFLFLHQYYSISVFISQYNLEKEKRYNVYSDLIVESFETKIKNHDLKGIETFANKLEKNNLLLYLRIIDNKTKKDLWSNIKTSGSSSSSFEDIYKQLKLKNHLLKHQNITEIYRTVDDHNIIIWIYDSNSVPIISAVIVKETFRFILSLSSSVLLGVILLKVLGKLRQKKNSNVLTDKTLVDDIASLDN